MRGIVCTRLCRRQHAQHGPALHADEGSQRSSPGCPLLSCPPQGGSALRLDFSALLGPLFFTCETGCCCCGLSASSLTHAPTRSTAATCFALVARLLRALMFVPSRPHHPPLRVSPDPSFWPAGLLQLLLPLMLFNLVYEKERRLRTIMKVGEGLGQAA